VRAAVAHANACLLLAQPHAHRAAPQRPRAWLAACTDARVGACASERWLTPGVAGAPIEWETFQLSGQVGRPGYVKSVPKEVMESIQRNKVCLKGALRERQRVQEP